MLKVVEFIKNNIDWEEKLSKDPYNIKIKRDNGFIILNYNQISSDFYNPIVKECRGIILEDGTYNPVCVPFFKFGNYGEGYADKIDWKTARVQEKVDGSLIKLWWYKDKWYVSTNSMIDAKKAYINNNKSPYKNFHELFEEGFKRYRNILNELDRDCTYMFELISPYNKIVVPYENIDIVHIGTRNNITLEELDIDIGIPKPKEYKFNSLEDCIEMSKKLPYDNEGYVVVDSKWRRVKIKSPAYVSVHRLINNELTDERVLDLIKENEHEEFLVYFPEYKERFNSIERRYTQYIDNVRKTLDEADTVKSSVSTRKEYASWALKQICPSILFMYYDNKISKDIKSIKEYFGGIPTRKLLKFIEEEVMALNVVDRLAK